MRSSATEDKLGEATEPASLSIEQRAGIGGVWQWLWSGSIVQQMGRVFGGFTVLVLILVAAAVAGTLRVDQKVESFALLSDVYVVSTELTLDLGNARQKLGSSGLNETQAQAEEDAARMIAAAKAKISQILALKSVPGTAEVPIFVRNFEVLEGFQNDVLAIEKELNAGSLSQQQRVDTIQSLDNLMLRLANLRDDTNEMLYVLSDQGIAEVHRLVQLLAVVGLISAILVVVGKHAVTRRIAEPIALISDASERIARGETSHIIPQVNRDDEIGKLAQSLSVLREVQQRALAQAQRELEREKVIQQEREAQHAKQAEAMHALAEQFEATIGDVAREVANASSELAETASNLVQSVDSSSSRVELASHRLEDASRGMTGAASASDEFALSISEVSSQALISSERARKAAEAATSADATISEMTQSADKISQIVEVIAAIAHRTNLLALNASIEAARSAEAGRGFAVVANEVKELAAQTRRETAQVEELITTMQNATGQSASALSTIAMEVIELETSAGAIASAVDQQASAGQDLARAIDLAATNTGQVNESFTDVTSLMSASMTTSSQLRDSSERLNAQSERLREHVAKFLEQVRAA